MARSDHIIKLSHGQRGGIAILFALCLPVLLGFAALAIDLARLNLTKVELQNAADAAAIGGARSLTDPGALPFNWAKANIMATSMAQQNVANGRNITDATIEDGYWNILTKSWIPVPIPDVQPVGYVPAIRATIDISSTKNNGPLKLFFGSFLGKNTQAVSASAIALIASPGGGTGFFPFAINKEMFDLFWDSTTNSPKFDPKTGKPFSLQMGSIYDNTGKVDANGTINSGQWTPLNDPNTGTSTMSNWISSSGTSNTLSVNIGDKIWVAPGAKATLYGDTKTLVNKNEPNSTFVTIYVVDKITVKTQQTVVAIGGFQITSADQAKKIIYGNFIDNVTASGSNPGSGIAPIYGAYTPPLLVQ
ncbi:MAG: pilus assembly protein TadG-related protein [Chlorobiaceae bacterium]